MNYNFDDIQSDIFENNDDMNKYFRLAKLLSSKEKE